MTVQPGDQISSSRYAHKPSCLQAFMSASPHSDMSSCRRDFLPIRKGGSVAVRRVYSSAARDIDPAGFRAGDLSCQYRSALSIVLGRSRDDARADMRVLRDYGVSLVQPGARLSIILSGGYRLTEK